MSDDYLWPEPGRPFFQFKRSRPDAYTWMRRSLDEYAYMYEQSADLLMEQASDAPGLLNVYAIPAVYLFRHFVELSLKDLLARAGRLVDEAVPVPDRHRLEPLWIRLRKLLEDERVSESEDDRMTMDVVGDMIRELDSADGGSMSFRYPTGKAGKDGTRTLLLADEFEYFDMRAFRDQATRLAHFISGCGDQLSAYLDWKDEMDREYGDDGRDDW